MFKKIKIKPTITFMLLLSCFLSFSHLEGIQSSLYAQSNGDPFAEDDPFADDQEFEDFELDEFQFEDEEGSFTGIGEDEFNLDSDADEDDGEYVDENVLSGDTQGLLRQALLSRRDLLAEEKANFGFNIAYGAGTGLMIGGWFALIDVTGNSRDTLRSIGLGLVLGGLMGAIIGGRSVIAPQTVPNNFSLLIDSPQTNQPQLLSSGLHTAANEQDSAFKLSFQWGF